MVTRASVPPRLWHWSRRPFCSVGRLRSIDRQQRDSWRSDLGPFLAPQHGLQGLIFVPPTQSAETEPNPSTGAVAAKPRGRAKVAKVALIVSLILVAAMWVYGFMFAPSKSPELIDDRAWVAAAESACAAQKAKINALPNARSFKDITPRSEALRQRADVADQATRYVRELLTQLHATTPAGEHSVSLVTRWLKDWDIYVADRDAHVAQYRAGLDPPFAQTANELGAPGPIRMDQFSRTNLMVSCQVPLDLG
jgi:hypothetical protein